MPATLPLSMIVITHDAEDDIAECLASAAFAAESVVVDSGSADHTVDVAKSRGARVLQRAWTGFGPQKQFGVDAASHDWVLCLDADERVTPALARSLEALFAHGEPDRAAYEVARRNRFLGRWLAHGEGYPDRIVRLFDRRRARWSSDAVHEHVVASGPVGRLDGDLLHMSAESIERYIEKQNRYTTLQADILHARGARSAAPAMFFSPLVRFARNYIVRLGFLDGAAGFAHSAIGAFASFMKHAKLRALERDAPASAAADEQRR